MTATDPSTLSWEDLKEHLYYVDGSWRDIYVPGSTREDWRKWADYVNATYRVRFWPPGMGEDVDRIDIDEASNCWGSEGEGLRPDAIFYVGGIAVKCHFFCEGEIENDIDPGEIDSYTTHLQLMNYLKAVSRVLGKGVLLTGENDYPRLLTASAEVVSLVGIEPLAPGNDKG